MKFTIELILFTTVSVTLFVSARSVPKCLLGQDTFPCADNDVWKDNIQCRLQGPTENNQPTNTGYIQRVEANPNDDKRSAAVKDNAYIVYTRIVNQMVNLYPYWTTAQRQSNLAQWERLLNTHGKAVYGTNWVTSSVPCGLATGVSAVCGDIGGTDLVDVVPICP